MITEMDKIKLPQISLPDWGLNNWEQWSYFAVIIGVLVNGAFLWMLIRQVRQGQKALKAADKSAQAAQSAVKEAMKTRIDAKTPKVIAILDKPLVHGLVNGNSFEVKSDPEYVLPGMRDAKLLLIVEGTLLNEGSATARVRLNGNGGCFIDKDEDGEEPWFVGEIPASNEERVLAPGDELRFAWSDGHTLDDWADAYNEPDPPNPHGACFMEIIVTDYLEDGVIDHIHLELSGRPIIPVEGDGGRWKPNKADEVVATAHPIHRTYRSEGWRGLTPPWQKTYQKWTDKHESN